LSRIGRECQKKMLRDTWILSSRRKGKITGNLHPKGGVCAMQGKIGGYVALMLEGDWMGGVRVIP